MGIFKRKRSRKYPIQYDDKGKSLRARSSDLFDELVRPTEAAKELGMKESTAKRYYYDWKKLGPNFDQRYTYTKELFKKTNPNRDRNLELYARVWGIHIEELETILSQPNGLRRLLTGRFYFPGHANADYKRHVALEAAVFITEHLIEKGGKFEDVLHALERLMKERQEYRNEEEINIKEENKDIEVMRQILEAADKAEQEGRVQPERLTNKEINDIFKYGLEAKMKLELRGVETQYWYRIAELMGTGLSKVQARDKMYQDLLDKGDLEGAKTLRRYQDMIHPMKPGKQNPPMSSSEKQPTD